MDIEFNTPGIVVIRQLLSKDEQDKIIDFITKQGGLKSADGEWNFFGKRGRRFDRLVGPYNEVKDVIDRAQKIIQGDERYQIPYQEANHMLTLWYPDKGGMGWHVDDHGTNNGDENCPVYSLTLGNECIFDVVQVGKERTDRETYMLKSGDMIVFGGPQRLIQHRVRRVIPNTYEGFNARINLTFRQCTDINTEDYTTEKYTERMTKKWDNKRK